MRCTDVCWLLTCGFQDERFDGRRYTRYANMFSDCTSPNAFNYANLSAASIVYHLNGARLVAQADGADRLYKLSDGDLGFAAYMTLANDVATITVRCGRRIKE